MQLAFKEVWVVVGEVTDPEAHQGDAVLARLRQIQLEMTAKTLSRCVSRQLLSPEQAAQLSRELAESPTRP